MKATPIDEMHERHGVNTYRHCGTCAFCVSVTRPHAGRGTVSHRVCRKSPEPARTAHRLGRRRRWKTTWSACGLFQEGSDA